MEFKDLEQQFEGFTADQVCTLATYGKDILNIAGTNLLATGLISLATAVLISDDIDTPSYKDELANILQIANITSELNDRCWNERKTLLGLTGVDFDNGRFQLEKRINFQK